MNFSALILAAGSGKRFGDIKKQFMLFEGKELYKWVLDQTLCVLPRERIVVVGVDVPGGDTRSKSVINGLDALPLDTERVIILEAARPLVTSEQIEQLLSDEHPSVSFVMPCVNTVVYRNGTFINRNELYDLLVPQAFDYCLLKKAYDTKKYLDSTDETRIMFEEYGIKPFFIETRQNLFPH